MAAIRRGTTTRRRLAHALIQSWGELATLYAKAVATPRGNPWRHRRWQAFTKRLEEVLNTATV